MIFNRTMIAMQLALSIVFVVQAGNDLLTDKQKDQVKNILNSLSKIDQKTYRLIPEPDIEPCSNLNQHSPETKAKLNALIKKFREEEALERVSDNDLKADKKTIASPIEIKHSRSQIITLEPTEYPILSPEQVIKIKNIIKREVNKKS